jgi:PAS domain S-box-containing protein
VKISNRFAVIGVVCAVASIAIGVALVASTNRVAEELRKNRAAADIVESVEGLRYLTLEYARQPEERVEMQWASRHKSLGGLLAASSSFDSKEERAGFAQMRAAYYESTKTFAELIRAQHARQAGEGHREILDELVSRLTAATASKTLVMMTESFRLQDASRDEVAVAQRDVLMAVIVLSSVLVSVVGASMFFAFRSIAVPLARLREGTHRVGAGDLEHTIGLTGGDEVADLAREFDKMSARLKTTTVSRNRLAESEERTRLILETALDAVVSIDSHGEITGWNPQAEAVFGWERQEILGRLLTDTIVPHSQRDAHRDGLQRYLQTGEGAVLNKRIELSALRRDGSEFPVELAITPIRSGGAVTFSAFLRDITERKHAEAKVHAQLARLDLLNRITRAIGERQDLQSIFQVVIRSLEDSAPIDFSCVCLHDPVANHLKVVGVGVKSAPLAMQLAMPEQAHIPVDENGLSRCVRGQLVYEPDAAEVGFPFPQRLAKGGLRSLVVAPLLVESKVFGVLVAARKESHAFSSGECEFLRQLSEHVGLASHQAQLYGALQQAYDDLRQTQQVVMQQERLRALGQMASGIAHDINNAISPVALYTEALLETEPGLSPRARSNLEIIQRAVDDVAHTVARMREFYRAREPQLALAPVDMNRLVQQVLDLTRARWNDMPQQRGIVIRLERDLPPELPAIMGAESEIREALINLVFNAVDAMPGGGKLTVKTQVVRPAADPELGHVQVSVSDDGVGMDEDTRRRCLEPFFTTKGERGTGLGLAMVYGVATRHSAELEIESAPGKGTTMRLSFPVSGVVGTAAVSTQPTAVRTRLRLLLVDDDPLLLKSLRDVLEPDGHVVVTANDGQSGIDEFRAATTRNERFDAVITDLGMPYVDGRQVAEAVKRSSPSTLVILLTGWGQRLIAEGEVPPHVDCVISKPPKLREIREALASRGIARDAESGI